MSSAFSGLHRPSFLAAACLVALGATLVHARQARPDAIDAELRRLAAAGYPVVDYHVHLKGGLTIADVLRRTKEHGIKAGVAINGGLNFPAQDDASVVPFLNELEGQPVYVAFQAEGREWARLFSPAGLSRFDYLFTDAMTWTDDSGKRMRLWIEPEVGEIPDPERFMDTLVDRAVGIVSNEPIDLHVNPTFLPESIAAGYERLWTPVRMDRLIRALVARGVGLEINNRYRIPSVAFVKRAKAAGVKFACGTNNSGPGDLGRMEYCVSVIRDASLAPSDMWTPPAKGHKAIDRRADHSTQP
jgi:hypothetical protein